MKPIACLALLALTCSLASNSAPAAELGIAAAPLAIDQWVKGKPVDLKDGKGKNLYVVEFWATWCPPCRESIPHLTEMQKKLKDKGVVFVGVTDEEVGKVKPFVEKMGDKMDYIVAVDKGGKTSAGYMEAFGIGGIPHAFVVNKDGVIAWHGHPMAGLDKALEEMLAGKYDIEAAKQEAKAEAQVEQYFELVTGDKKPAGASELGGQIVTSIAKNSQMLNQFAWVILTEEAVKHRDLPLATRAAKLAFDNTAGKDAAIVDTYARALFDTGKTAEAIKLQKQAIAICKDAKMKAELEATLAGYEKKVAK